MKMLYRAEGDGEPIILVPGGLTGCISWEPHARRLAATRKAVRVQLLNVEYGLKDRPLPPDYTLRTEAGALKATMDEVVPGGPADIVAWSFGAAAALIYAMDEPDRVRTLTLIEPPAFWVLGPEYHDPRLDDLRRSSEEIRGEVSGDQLVELIRLLGFSPPDVDPMSLPQWPLWMKHRRSLRGNLAPFITRDDPARLADLPAPVLLVKGTGSAPFFHAVIDELARRLPSCEVVEYPAGHAPHIVSMDRFMEKMSSFQAQRGRAERVDIARQVPR